MPFVFIARHNGFLRFTSGATLADLLAASKATELLIHVFAYLQALVWDQIQDHACHCMWQDKCSMEWVTLARPLLDLTFLDTGELLCFNVYNKQIVWSLTVLLSPSLPLYLANSHQICLALESSQYSHHRFTYDGHHLWFTFIDFVRVHWHTFIFFTLQEIRPSGSAWLQRFWTECFALKM